jgi:hypothetical protein
MFIFFFKAIRMALLSKFVVIILQILMTKIIIRIVSDDVGVILIPIIIYLKIVENGKKLFVEEEILFVFVGHAIVSISYR